MLQTKSSSIPWNDVLYSNWCLIFTIIILILRIIIVVMHRKMYARPVIVSVFLVVKITIDYLMFKGVERFSSFSEQTTIKILLAIEIIYVIISNFMIYSIFYADFTLPLKVIIQFTTFNLISIAVAMVLLIAFENLMCSFTIILSLHFISILLYRDKCSGLLKCGIYNVLGKTIIYISILFKLIFDHLLRIFYISNLLFNIFDYSPSRDVVLYITQIIFTCLLLFFFIFYRRQNSENIGPVFAAEKKISLKTKIVRQVDSEFVFENAAEELMFPAENELNTISDIASEDMDDFDLEEELAAQNIETEIVSARVSSREPSIFATAESGRSRRHEHRIQIMRRTLTRVASIECYHPSSLN